jgi:hypothetical protein
MTNIITLSLARLLPGLAVALLVSPATAVPPPPVPDAPPGAATYAPEHFANTPSVELARELFSDWARGLLEKRLDEGPAFYTKPRVGAVEVCEVTRLRFTMATPTMSTDGKSYVRGAWIEQLYHLVHVPRPFSARDLAPVKITSGLCDGLAAGTKYFSAPSASVASYQHLLIDEAIKQSKANGRLDFKLGCLRGSGPACDARAILSKLDAFGISSIKQRDCAGYSRHECYEVKVGDWVLETENTFSTYGYSPVEPDRILVSIGLSKLPYDLVVD